MDERQGELPQGRGLWGEPPSAPYCHLDGCGDTDHDGVNLLYKGAAYDSFSRDAHAKCSVCDALR